MAPIVFYIAILIIPFFLEGIGLFVDRRIFIFVFSFLSTFFSACYLFSKNNLRIPKLFASISGLLFALLAISLCFFSIDKQVSFELLLLYFSAFLFFLFFYNHKKEGEQIALYTPLILGCFFSLYSLSLPLLTKHGLTLLLPKFEKQFIFPSYGSHNHLGDFLGMALIILLFNIRQRKWLVFVFAFFSYLFAVSFSRSAYLSFFVVCTLLLFVYRRKLPAKILPLSLGILGILLFLLILASVQNPTHRQFSHIQTIVKKKLSLSPRNLFAARDIFTIQALSSIKTTPLFGIGGGNFIFASKKYVINNNTSDSAHNIFLEFATEQGLIALIAFGALIFSVIKKVFLSPSPQGFLFLYLLLNFQTDYTYQFYSLFVFFVILASVVYREKNEIVLSSSYLGFLGIIPLFVLVCICTSTLFVKIENYETALIWYPYNKKAYAAAIESPYTTNPETYIKKADRIAPYDTYLLTISGKLLEKIGARKEALARYERIYGMNRYCSFLFVKKIYTLKKQINSKENADIFFRGVITDYEQIFIPENFLKEFTGFCKKENIPNCATIGWNR